MGMLLRRHRQNKEEQQKNAEKANESPKKTKADSSKKAPKKG
jgi:hypothetical protein